jgi:hypothetical protein
MEEMNNSHHPERLRISDLNQYLNSSGLRNEPQGAESYLNVSEATKRVEEEAAYQAKILREAFPDTPNPVDKQRLDLLKHFERMSIHLKSSNGLIEVPVQDLAFHCDTILAFARAHIMFKEKNCCALEFSLDSFSIEAVKSFLDTLNGTISPCDISDDHVLECCQIAHYLQCKCVLDPLVDILVESVDGENCKILLQLSDQLNLPRLFEQSLSFMMQSLEQTQEVWEDLPSDLRTRIELMKQAIQSSILAGKSRLYFTSLEEYLAMFAETLNYHRERLADAKQRQEETRKQFLARSRAWEYNQKMIMEQELRVCRLEVVMEKQKVIFCPTNRRPHMEN